MKLHLKWHQTLDEDVRSKPDPLQTLSQQWLPASEQGMGQHGSLRGGHRLATSISVVESHGCHTSTQNGHHAQ